jgi:BlaI family penicillinase repressor
MAKDRELPPPLEMMCLNALWDIGEGNVEEVRRVVSQNRPLAYTTVLTLLDRLARRGAVSRRKEGRGFRYQPTVARDKLRRMALVQFLEYHFEGSVAKLKIFLEQPVEQTIEQPVEQLQAPVADPSAPAPTDSADDSAFSAVVGGGSIAPPSIPEA